MKQTNPSRAAKEKRRRDIDFLSVPRGWGDAQPAFLTAQHDPQRGRGVHDPRLPREPVPIPDPRITETPDPRLERMPDPRMPDMLDPHLSELLDIIREAVRKEAKKTAFYDFMIAKAPSAEDKRIIQRITDGELKHLGMFRQLYEELTGEPLPYEPAFTLGQHAPSYCAGLKQGLMDQQEAVETYREILFALDDREQINMMTEIITDELRHLGLYNYLYAKNRCTE